MRPILFLLPAVVAGALVPSAAIPQTVNVSLTSRYVDNTFNDALSKKPSLQTDISYDLSKHVYVSAYAYTGFEKPFADDSSEYGFEVGGKWSLSKKATVTLATGRYANYQGKGFDVGDWYAKAGLTYGRANVSASVLRGVTNTVLINSSYRLPITKRLTVTPSIAYFTAQKKLNPGVAVDYRISKRVSIGGKFVLPQDDITRRRTPYGAATLTYAF